MIERRLRPMGLGDIFDEAFDLYKNNLLTLALITACVSVPIKVALSIGSFTYLQNAFDFVSLATQAPDYQRLFQDFGRIAWIIAAATPAYLIAIGLQYTALASATSSLYLRKPVTVWSVYRPLLRRIISLGITSILVGLSVIVCFYLCCIPVLLPLTLYLVAPQVFAAEGRRLRGAMLRSRELTAPDAGRILGCLLMLVLLSSAIGSGLQVTFDYALQQIVDVIPGSQNLLVASIAGGGPHVRDQIMSQISSEFSEILVFPFIFCVTTVLYYDLRLRREAFDIELLAAELGYPPLDLKRVAIPAFGYLPAGQQRVQAVRKRWLSKGVPKP